jgi:hypothetical protein
MEMRDAPLLDDILGVRQANIEQTVIRQVGLIEMK